MELLVTEPQAIEERREAPTGLWGRLLLVVSAGWAVFVGLLPHVLHHAGPLAGAALFAGVGGSLLFGAIGLIAAVPFLLRLHRRFANWQAPAIALAVFIAVFSLSTFVIGPAITGGGDDESSGQSSNGAPPGVSESAHEQHH